MRRGRPLISSCLHRWRCFSDTFTQINAFAKNEHRSTIEARMFTYCHWSAVVIADHWSNMVSRRNDVLSALFVGIMFILVQVLKCEDNCRSSWSTSIIVYWITITWCISIIKKIDLLLKEALWHIIWVGLFHRF